MTKAKILVVDDSQLDLDVFHEALTKIGYDCVTLCDAKQCVSFAKEIKPNVILLDINMPDISGFDVCKQLKEDPETNQISVIFLSAYTDVNTVLQGIHVGALDYLPKPIRTVDLIKNVATRTATELMYKASYFYHSEMQSLATKYKKNDSSIFTQ